MSWWKRLFGGSRKPMPSVPVLRGKQTSNTSGNTRTQARSVLEAPFPRKTGTPVGSSTASHIKSNTTLDFLASLPSEPPLHVAVKKGDKDAVKSLLASDGIDVNAKYMGTPALHEAVDRRDKAIAELLLAHGADVDAKGMFGTQTPLQNAATKGAGFARKVDKELVELLLAHGADVNASEDNDWTALHQVAQDSDKDMAEVLLAHKADVNAKGTRGWTPLHRAAMKGHTDVAALLLAHGANITTKDKDGLTPTDWAVKNGHRDVAELMRQHGSGIETWAPVASDASQSSSPSKTAYSEAALSFAVSNGHVAIVRDLLKNGADVNAKNFVGMTGLHDAANNGLSEMAELLLSHGADVNAKDALGNTPLHNAVFNSQNEVAELLRKHGGHE